MLRAANGLPIVRCGGCRTVYTDARSVATGAAALYPPFEQTASAAQRRVRAGLSVFRAARARVVESVVRAGTLLDYGAGSGAFARYMAGRGHTVVGLEPYSLGAPLEEPGLRLLRAPLATLVEAGDRFDAITLWHVLEHVDRPVALLAELRGLLRPGGAIVISVPNFASWQRAVFGARWFHLDPPRHLIHFEPDTLDTCLERAGLRVVARFPDLAEYGASGWVQSALNGLLPRENFLYEWVKDRGALAGVGTASRVAHLGASVAAAGPIAAASLPVEALAARRGRAAALTV
ncbi:MAG: class I SAM-dependent methyltransferase, partial [Myxococcota bacterium]